MQKFTQQAELAPKDLYQDVTDRIIAALEKGTVPWRKPWRIDGNGQTVQFGFPMNACTSRNYSGVNVLLLWLEQLEKGYSSSKWLTFRQAIVAGGKVKKGEKSTVILWYKPIQKHAKDGQGELVFDDQGHPIMEESCILKCHHLFNTEQCENLPQDLSAASSSESTELVDDHTVDTLTYNRIIHLIQSIGVKFASKNSDCAYYRPSTDEIVVPASGFFFTEQDYWSTVLHEVVHSTGHESRLNREGVASKEKRFGNATYAAEELIAEIGSAFLCATLNITGELQHESYIDHWLQILKADKKAIVKASKNARLACEYLLSFEENEASEPAHFTKEDALAA